MTKTIRIITLLAVMIITAGHTWARGGYGKIYYEYRSSDGGGLVCYATPDDASASNDEVISCQQDGNNPHKLTYDPNNATLSDGIVYIAAGPAFGYTGLNATITAEKSGGSDEAQAPRRRTGDDDPGVGQTIPVTAVNGHPGVYQFTMPDDGSNVTLSATFNALPTNTAAISYIDADGKSQSKAIGTVYVLDGTDFYLGQHDEEYHTAINPTTNKPYETWYVCNSDLTYKHYLRLFGDVHLILADGAAMTVTNTSGNAIYSQNDISIYGQSTGNNIGSLSVTAGSGCNGLHTSAGLTISHCKVIGIGYIGIYGKDVTIVGSDITATSTSAGSDGLFATNAIITNSNVTAEGKLGIFATNDITINGGKVVAKATGNISNDSGIYVVKNLSVTNCDLTAEGVYMGINATDITINGGKVVAKATGTSSSDYEYGIFSNGVVSISNCTLTATGDNTGIAGNDIIITGGKIEATGTNDYGIWSKGGNITLDWTNTSDYIKASNFYVYSYKAVKTAEGKALKYTDGDNTVKVIGTVSNVSAIADKTLTPYGIWGYCGMDDAETDVDESKNLTWDISLATNATSADQLGTTLTIQGSGEMADYNKGLNVFAPWIKRKTINTGAGEYYEPDGLKYSTVNTIVIADGVASIGLSAFESCTGIQNVSLGSDVAFIEQFAFKGCTGIQSITFPASVGTIHSGAFKDCTNLTTVTIERDGSDSQYPTTGVSDDAFEGCSNLTVIFIPNEAVYSEYAKCAGSKQSWDSKVNDISLLERFAPQTITVAKNKSGWGTYCHDYPVRYSMSDGNEGDKAPKAYTVSGLGTDGKSVTLGSASATVAPITPLLLNYTAPDGDAATDDETITFTALPETATTNVYDYYPVISNGYGTDVIFYGNTTYRTQKHNPNATNPERPDDPTPIDDHIPALTGVSGWAFYGLYNGEFVLIDTDNGIPAHRCVLAVSNGTGAPVLTISEGTTNIKTTDFTDYTDKSDAWYTLDGRKLDKQPTAKGIYINNGRKVVVK